MLDIHKKSIKIADSELEIMRVLWREGRPLSFTEIRTALESTTDWKKTTIQTMLVRLRDKGVITARQDHVALYTPNITEDEYIQAEGQHFINRLFDGSAAKLAATLCRGGRLNEADVDELKAYFQMEGGGKK